MKSQQVAGRRINASRGQLIWSWSSLAGSSLIAQCFLAASTVGKNISSALCGVLGSYSWKCWRKRRKCQIKVVPNVCLREK